MGGYLRLLTVNDRDVPLATLQRAVPLRCRLVGRTPRDARQYLAIGPEPNEQHYVSATVDAIRLLPIPWVLKKESIR